jgi:hypothetical protein
MLAGLVVNSAGLPPREKRRNWRALCHQASIAPEKFADKVSQIRGISAFVNEYNSDLATRYRQIANNISNKE